MKKVPVTKKPTKKKKYIDYTMTSWIEPVKKINGKKKDSHYVLKLEISSKKEKDLEDLLPWIEEYVKNLPEFMKKVINENK